VSVASTTRVQGQVVRSRIFRTRTCEAFATFARPASLWLRDGCAADDPRAAEFCGRWPSAGLVVRRRAYRLDGSGHVVCEGSSGRWPTPNAMVSNFGERPLSWLRRRERLKQKRYNGNGAGMPLAIAAQIGPDWREASPESISPAHCGALNPVWVEWLMGFPIGWTDCGLAELRRGRAA
jgi:hypothetical protein